MATYQELHVAMQLSDSDEEARHAKIVRRGGLVPRHRAKLISSRKYFDSGEFFSARQGKVLQDMLPGGAPVHACPVKSTPTTFVSHGKTLLQTVYDQDPNPGFKAVFSVSDY